MRDGEIETRPRESLWIAQPRKPRWAASLLVVVFAVQAPNIVRHMVQPLIGETVALIVEAAVYGALLALVFAWVGHERRARRVQPQDLALVDGAFGDQCLVEVTVVANDTRLGTDRGVLWFADGLMGFSGDASSFVLAATDVTAPAFWTPEAGARKGKREKLRSIMVTLQGAPGAAKVIIVPLSGQEEHFRERLAAFLKADERPEAERFWPPLTPYRAFEEQNAALS